MHLITYPLTGYMNAFPPKYVIISVYVNPCKCFMGYMNAEINLLQNLN